MNVAVIVTALSDKGKVRDHNEDAWFTNVDRGLFIVADGLGGCAGGKVASKMVTDHLPSLLEDTVDLVYPLHSQDSANSIGMAINKLNRMVCETGREHPELRGMGSTLVLAMIRGEAMLIAHVGDSRAYLLHDGSFSRLTRDLP